MKENIRLSDGLWYSKEEINNEIMKSRRIIHQLGLQWADWAVNGWNRPDDDVRDALELTSEEQDKLLKLDE